MAGKAGKHEAQLSGHINKKKLTATDWIYAGLLFILYAASTFMFYRQTIRFNGGYEADTSLYVNMSMDDRGVRLIKWIYHYLYNLTGNTVLIAVYMGAVVVCTALANYAVFRWYLRWNRERKALKAAAQGAETFSAASAAPLTAAEEARERVYAQAASLIMFVTGSMYLPVIHARFYRASWCTYAWHSPTQQLMILFAMLSLLLFLRIYENYMDRIDPKMWAGLMVTSLISVWAKPSFMLVFTPVLIVVFLIELAVHAKDGQTAKRFKRLVIFGLSMVPSGILILFLNSSIYGEGSKNKVAVSVGGADGFGYNIYIAAFCGLLFPALVFIFNYKRLKELPYQISLGMLIMGIAEWMIFYEEGSRTNSGNFAWGRQFGCYYFFVCAIALAYANWNDSEFLAGRKGLRKAYFAVIAVALAMHVLSQTYHLYLMFRGYDFYI